jgi:hypothetical protein
VTLGGRAVLRSTGLAGVAVLLGAAAPPERQNLICDSIVDLGLTAIASGTPQRVFFGRVSQTRATCGPDDAVPTHQDFCNAVVKEVGVSNPNRFPWMVYECLGMSHGIPDVETADEYSGVEGRKKVRLLRASLKNGLAIEIRFGPTGDFGTKPFYKNYFGTYVMTIWKP